MKSGIGKRRSAIAEGYIPEGGHGPEPMQSHETPCILNVTVPAHRTVHVRLDKLDDPEPIPRVTEYASTFDSHLPVVVQHMRLGSRQSENALMTTIAFGSD
jgi:hypothetical protein